MEIGAPTNFKHVTHIGWDEANGFEVKNLPEEWKSLFKAAQHAQSAPLAVPQLSPCAPSGRA